MKSVVNLRPRIHDPSYVHSDSGTAFIETSAYQEAVVVDVITNDSHELFSQDGYTVGGIRFRFLKDNNYRKEIDLHFALPIEANIQEYPLLNEIVLIFKALGRWHYTRKLNVTNEVYHQAIFGLNSELSEVQGATEARRSIQTAQTVGAHKQASTTTNTSLGKTFEPNKTVKKLRHEEGDIIIEGRSGQSLRFGIDLATKSPNVLIRAGQGAEVKNELVTEDINKDASSVYIVSNQTVPLELATVDTTVHLKSIENPPRALSGKQILLNSDRIVFNSKNDRIMGFSFGGIHWTTIARYSIDTAKGYTLYSEGDVAIRTTKNQRVNIEQNSSLEVGQTLSERIGQDKTVRIGKNYRIVADDSVHSRAANVYSITSPKVYLGSAREEEPIVCGRALVDFMVKLIDAHLKAAAKHVITPVGPGALSPSVVSELTKLKADLAKGKLASFNSKVSFTKK